MGRRGARRRRNLIRNLKLNISQRSPRRREINCYEKCHGHGDDAHAHHTRRGWDGAAGQPASLLASRTVAASRRRGVGA